jgi:hypothetical protein
MGFCIKYPAIILSCVTVAILALSVTTQQRAAYSEVLYV